MRKLNEESRRRLREFWPTGKPLRELSKETGVSISWLSQKAKDMGLPPRQGPQLKAWLENAGDGYIRQEAARRGMTVAALTTAVFSAVINDRLVGAILDDESRREVA